MSTSRKTLRQAIIQRLYSPRRPTASTTTSTGGDNSTIKDTILSPAGLTEDFIGAWIYLIVSGKGPSQYSIVRCTDVEFSGSNSEITISPAWTELQNDADYEIHYVFHPDEINDLINDIIRDGSRDALSALSVDGDETTFEYDLILDGALFVLKRRLSTTETGQEAFRLKKEAQFHESNYRAGLIRGGYQPLAILRVEDEDGNN